MLAAGSRIGQGTDREALHLAQVILMALREGPKGPAGDYPERGYTRQQGVTRPGRRVLALAGVAAAVAAAVLLGIRGYRSRRHR